MKFGLFEYTAGCRALGFRVRIPSWHVLPQCFIVAGQDARELGTDRNRSRRECPVDCTGLVDQIVFAGNLGHSRGFAPFVLFVPGNDTRSVRVVACR